LDDILKRARILRALATLREADPQPVTQGKLMEATGYDFRAITKLVDDCLRWKLITVKETTRGKLPVNEHRLTPGGREVADLAIKLAARAEKLRHDGR
jgi:MoaA/NifB/PqqE/SkfB family radical SAM enzyme